MEDFQNSFRPSLLQPTFQDLLVQQKGYQTTEARQADGKEKEAQGRTNFVECTKGSEMLGMIFQTYWITAFNVKA